MLTPKLRWLGALLISVLLLLWRVLDFLDEGLHHDYHMSRVGLSVMGHRAEWLQILLILVCLGMFVVLRVLVSGKRRDGAGS